MRSSMFCRPICSITPGRTIQSDFLSNTNTPIVSLGLSVPTARMAASLALDIFDTPSPGVSMAILDAGAFALVLPDDRHTRFGLEDYVREPDVVAGIGITRWNDAHANRVKALAHDCRRDGDPILALTQLDVLFAGDLAIDRHLQMR